MTRPVLTPHEMRQWLLENVRIDGDCRIWAGSTTGSGDPEVMWNRKRYPSRRLLGQLLGMCRDPSYVSWTSCGNKRCMAPEHIRFGTRKQMGLAMRRHGVYLTGSQRSLVSCLGRAPKAKLPITERRKVMALRAQGHTLQQIASVYGVHFDTVSKAIRAWNRALGQPVDFG